jgi:hypothetical protein
MVQFGPLRPTLVVCLAAMKIKIVHKLTALVFLFTVVSSARDWKQYPVVVEVDTTQDIYAVGDPHSDFSRLAGVLATAKIIAGVPAVPDKPVWTAGKSVLVITGDYIDKGPCALCVIQLVAALQSAAVAQGGQVILTMGNHEAEFLADPTGDKTKEFQDELIKAKIDPASVARCQGDLGAFLCNLPIAARVNDWFFSHAGNTGGRSIAQLSAAIQAGVDKDGYATEELVGDNSILEARLNKKGPGGLPWIYDGKKKTDPQKLLTKYADALGIHHILQGHQPGNVKFRDGQERKQEDLFQRYDGLYFLNDGGMSTGIEGSTSIGGAMHITTGKVEAICAGGQTKTLWDSTNNEAIAAIHCSQ